MINSLESFRSCCHLSFVKQVWSDSSVWAYECASVALCTLCAVPFRNAYCNASLLVCGSTEFPLTVNVRQECGYRQAVSIHVVDWQQDVLDLLNESFRSFERSLLSVCSRVSPLSRNVDLNESVSTGVDSLVVHVYDILALLEVGLCSSILHVLDSICLWQYLCE